jgi:histone deacetylase 1/2
MPLMVPQRAVKARLMQRTPSAPCRQQFCCVVSYRVHPCLLLLMPHLLSQRAVKAQPMQLGQFHSADYIDLLSVVTPDNQAEHAAAMQRHNFNEDCPVFDGLFEYCR